MAKQKKSFIAVSVSNGSMDVIDDQITSLKAAIASLDEYVDEDLNTQESLFILEFDGKDLRVMKSGKPFSGVQWK